MIENCREWNFIPRIYQLKFAVRKSVRFYRTQNCSFISPKIIGIPLSFVTIAKIPSDNLPMKMPAELPSTEQIFTKTSRLVPLSSRLYFLGLGSGFVVLFVSFISRKWRFIQSFVLPFPGLLVRFCGCLFCIGLGFYRSSCVSCGCRPQCSWTVLPSVRSRSWLSVM